MRFKKSLVLATISAMIFAIGSISAFADATISTAEELKSFRDGVNKGNAYVGETVTLTADIDLSSETEWTPIGNGSRSSKTYSGNSFKGTFDGGCHTISGLKVTTTNAKDAQ